MRRFFRAHRAEEDFSQIQYLTAKCTRLAQDKAALDREYLVSREKEVKLQRELQVAACRLFQQEQQNADLRRNQEQLVCRIQQQQDVVGLLQRRVVLLVQESLRDAELLQQVGSELHCLQSSEEKLEGLVEELHAEAQHRAAVAEGLQAELHEGARHRAALTEGLHAELHSKTLQLEELQETNRSLREELMDLREAHQEEVRELRRENEVSLRKLQETAEQFEWLCQQQRSWMSCVKRFKDSLLEDREALLRHVSLIQQKTKTVKSSEDQQSPAQLLCRPLLDTQGTASVTSLEADLESQVEESSMLYEELFNQTPSPINGDQKPP